MRTLIFASLALIAASSVAEAQSNSAPLDALMQYSTAHVDLPQDRPRFANLIFTYCSEVLRALPRNTPREESWLEEEVKSGVWDRMTRAMDSIEMARKSLVETFSQCVSVSGNLTKIVKAQPASEAVLWTRLAMTFSSQASTSAERLGMVKYDDKRVDIVRP